MLNNAKAFHWWSQVYDFLPNSFQGVGPHSSLPRFSLFIYRVATHQKVKHSLTFHWLLNSFHWPFINEKQSMFTFALAFFAGHQYFSLHFQPVCAFRGKKKKEFVTSIHNKSHWPKLLHVSGVECQIDRFACFAAFFSSFPKENAFQSLEENLCTINRKTEFPDFSLTLTISKIFPDFSLTLKNFRFSLIFPWQWQPWSSKN